MSLYCSEYVNYIVSESHDKSFKIKGQKFEVVKISPLFQQI